MSSTTPSFTRPPSLLQSLKGVGGKILVLSAAPLALMFALSFFSFGQLGGVFDETLSTLDANAEQSAEFTEKVTLVRQNITATTEDLFTFILSHERFLLTQNKEAIENLRTSRQALGDQFAQSAAIIEEYDSTISRFLQENQSTTPEIVSLHADIKHHINIVYRVSRALPNLFTMLSDGNERTLTLAEEDRFTKATSNFQFEETTRVDAIVSEARHASASLSQLQQLLNKALQNKRNDAYTDVRFHFEKTENFFGLLNVIIAISMAIFAAFFALTRVVSPLKRLTKAMKELASGQLDAKVPSGCKDEYRDMQGALHVFQERAIENRNLQEERKKAEAKAAENRRNAQLQLADDLENRLKDVLQMVIGNCDQLKSASKAMQSNAERVSTGTATVSAATEEASASVSNVSTATTELSASTSEIATQVARASTTASEAVSDAEATSRSIQALAASAQRIGDVLTMINDIAAQTNLLALNATIEAARAGDAGKGFAVVASEVKSLAGQTAKATEQIEEQISDIQSQTTGAVEAITQINAVISSINEVSASIAGAVEEQSAATNEISNSAEQASSGTQEVAQTITDVATMAQESGEMANSVSTVSMEMEGAISQLNTQIQHFLTEIRSETNL